MSHHHLLTTLAAARVTLRVEGGAIRYRAPRGALTPALRLAVIEAKPDILFEYEERAAIREHDGGLPRSVAERRAAADVLGTDNTITPATAAARMAALMEAAR
jgi:hypothetical protein